MCAREPFNSPLRAAFVLIFIWANSAAAAILDGLIVGVTDGDTVTVLDNSRTQYKVRLSGIDAPESHQPFGQRSRQHLASMVFQKRVTIEWAKRDRYGRILGKVLSDGNDINLKQVEAGLAWHFKKYAKGQLPKDEHRYAEAENHARALRIGLWHDNHPIPPWEWRKARKAARPP